MAFFKCSDFVYTKLLTGPFLGMIRKYIIEIRLETNTCFGQ